MAKTIVGVNDPKAVKKFAGALFNAAIPASFYGKQLMADANSTRADAEMANAPIVVINDLESQAGQSVSFDVFVQLTGEGTYGDDTLEGNEENLDSYTDEVMINQVRHGVDAGGKMTQKRTVNDLRAVAKTKLAQWHAQRFDSAMATTLGGARGVKSDLYIPLGATAPIKGASPYTPYDSAHIAYGGSATSKATLTASDKLGLGVVDRVITKIKSTGGMADGKLRLTPLDKGGKQAYIMTISAQQEQDLRTDAGTGGWLDIQKAAAGSAGYNSNLFKDVVGEYRDVTFKQVPAVVEFDDYGVGQNVVAHRAVIMGRQAAAVAFGSANSKNMRADWAEETKDYGNRLGVAAGMTYGMKLPQFNGQVVNSYAIDTAVTPLIG